MLTAGAGPLSTALSSDLGQRRVAALLRRPDHLVGTQRCARVAAVLRKTHTVTSLKADDVSGGGHFAAGTVEEWFIRDISVPNLVFSASA